jgi:N-acetylglucosaminyldiphosphoundecaprenol N-acetyl-beta-D-mannosaminyltransferase
LTQGTEQLQAIKVLGVQVHMVEIPDVVALMDHWVQTEPQRFHHVVNTGMHGVMEAHRDPEFKAVLNSADLFAPDGILMVLLARLRGFSLKKSRTGPTLMWDFSKVASEKGYKYYLYGDTEDTLRSLEARLTEAFPGLKIVGSQSPPFRSLTSEEDELVVRSINEAQPDVLWVALGAPNQERWISALRDRLNVPVVVGVGAAFKFLSGRVNRAPAWVRDRGFEWLWRLLHEPRRVWRRVLIDAPQFVGLVALELSGLKKYG